MASSSTIDEFPLKTTPGNVWPPLPSRMTGVWNAYLELCRTELYDSERVQALQLSQLAALLRHASEHVPFYRELFAKLDVSRVSDFSRIPILRRPQYQRSFDSFRAEKLPLGTKEGGKVHTAGSQGVPVEVLQTNMVHLWWLATSLRDLRWCGVDLRRKLASIRYFGGSEEQRALLSRGIELPCWDERLKDLMRTGPCFALDIHRQATDQLRWLRHVQPDYLISYPSNLTMLSRLAMERAVEVRGLRAILSISEALLDEDKALIEQAFGVKVHNTYSCMEAGYVASPCPRGRGLHVHSENVLMEIVDDEGRPVPRGVEGRVLLTTLRNFLTPLIRYDILDRASWAEQPCGCGIGLPLIDPPKGKKTPAFFLPRGGRKNSMSLAVGMRKIGGCAQFRILQEELSRVSVRLVPTSSWSAEHRARIEKLLFEFFEARVDVTIKVQDKVELSKGGKGAHLECSVSDQLLRVQEDDTYEE